MRITAQQYITNSRKKDTYVSVFKHYGNNSLDKRIEKEGDLYALIYLSGTDEIPAERVAKFVWDGIVDGYIYSNSNSTNESLKDAIKEGVRKTRDLIRNDMDLEKSGVNISFTIVAQRKEGIYVANLGENDIYVFRGSKLIDLVDVLKQNKAQTAGLALKEGELLMISTPNLLKEGISNFVGLKTIEEFNKTLKNFSENFVDDEGLLVLEMTEGEEEKKVIASAIETVKDQVMDIGKDTDKLVKNAVKKVESKKEEEIKMEEDEIKELKERKNFKIFEKDWAKKVLNILKKIGAFFGAVWLFMKKYLDKVGIFLQKVGGRFWNFLKERLGHQRWFKKISANFSQKVPRVSRPNVSAKGMRIDGYKQRNVRNSRVKKVVIAIVAVVLVVFGVNFTLTTKKNIEIHNAADVILISAEDMIVKAESNVNTDEDVTEKYIYDIRKSFEDLPEGMNEEDQGRVDDVESKIVELEDNLYRRVGVSNEDGSVTNFLDTRLSFGEGSTPTDIEIYSDNSGNEYLLVTDSNAKAVFRVSIYGKEVERLLDTDGVLSSPEYLSIGNSGLFVYDSNEGVFKASFDDNAWFESFVELSGLGASDIKSEDVSEFIVLTDTDNVYLLARDKGALLKSGFSYGNSYNLMYTYISNDGFANANDVIADFSLYFMADDLYRYIYSYVESKQVESSIGITGCSGDLGNLYKGYTRESLYYGLYMFDSSENRFFKFEKPLDSGEEILHPDSLLLLNQYIYRGTGDGVWENVRDFVVDGDEEYMYILDGSTVWRVKL